MQKTILFDLDGTLLDSTEAILEAFDGACDDLGVQRYSHESIKALIGYPLDLMYSILTKDEKNAWNFVDAYKVRYRPISKPKTNLLPNALEAVEFASAFARCGVVTTKTASYSHELLNHMGIGKYFEILIGRDSVTNPKPHPEPILKALDFMKIIPSLDCWMIGDTKLDLLCAKDAGVSSVAVLCGYGKEDELSQYTNIIHKDALEAVKYIQNL